MRTVMFLQKTNKYSGAENIVIMIMKLLPKEKYKVIYVSPEGEIKNFVERAGLKYYAMPNSSLKSIKKAIADIKPDIIHATDYGMSSTTVWATHNIPVVAHLHNNVPWLKKWYHPKNLFLTVSLPRITRVISVSDSIPQEYCHSDLLSSKNMVIQNVVNIMDIKEKAKEECEEGQFDIAFLGRQSPEKNPFYFCKLVKKINDVKPVKVCMIGDGELFEQVETYIKELGLEHCIKLFGFQANPYKYVTKSRILLMPSVYEGFGLAAVESMALGKPVICSGVGGLKDIVNSRCGKICSSDDEYVEETLKLLSDRTYYETKSQNAIERAKVFGNEQKYISDIIHVYGLCMKE